MRETAPTASPPEDDPQASPDRPDATRGVSGVPTGLSGAFGACELRRGHVLSSLVSLVMDMAIGSTEEMSGIGHMDLIFENTQIVSTQRKPLFGYDCYIDTTFSLENGFNGK